MNWNKCISGQSWEDKVKAMRGKLQEKNAYCVVISALDEVACMYIIGLVAWVWSEKMPLVW